jgi:mRNA degradation ribonuclease J1/J2
MDSQVLSERKRLAASGVVTVTVALSALTGLPVTEPSITSSGFMDVDESKILFKNASKEVSTTLEQIASKRLTLEEVKSNLNRSVKDFLYRETRRRPTVLTIIEQV